MIKHAWLPLPIVVVLTIKVKIIIRKHREQFGRDDRPSLSRLNT